MGEYKSAQHKSPWCGLPEKRGVGGFLQVALYASNVLSRKILAAKPGDPSLSPWDPHDRRVFPCREQVLLWPYPLQ